MASQMPPVLFGNTRATSSKGDKVPGKDGADASTGEVSPRGSAKPGKKQSFDALSCICGLTGAANTNNEGELKAAIPVALDGSNMMYAPVWTLNLCSGWNVEVHKRLQAAIQKVADQNPVFTGKLVLRDGIYCILPGVHKDLLHAKEGPSDYVVPATTMERVASMTEVLAPYFTDIGYGPTQLQDGGPVFRAEVLTLSDGFACISLSISHMVTDGAAYYQTMQLISNALQGKTIQPLKWIVVENQWLSDRDRFWRAVAPIPAVLATLAMRKLRGWKGYTIHVFAIDAEKCSKLKISMKRDCDFLSTNDVVTAAIAELLPGSTVNVSVDMRGRMPGRMPGTESDLGGNWVAGLLGSKEKLAGEPAAVRKLVQTSPTPDTWVPFKMGFSALATWDFQGITNWSGLTRFLEGGGMVAEAQCPIRLLEGGLGPGAVIFNADKKTTAVCITMNAEEFKELSKGKLMSQLVRA